MRKITFIIAAIVLAIFSSCQQKKETLKSYDEPTARKPFTVPADSLSSKRIMFALRLRDSVAKSWPNFNKKRVEGAFIYFNGDYSEVFFPGDQILDDLQKFDIDVVDTYSKDYLLAVRTDSIPYHFELMISFDLADSTKFYYDHPVQQFLSVEETGLYIPSVVSTEMWATMVIHEMFHHFQYNNTAFRKYVKDQVIQWPGDIRDLRALCEEDPEFLKAIQQENELLLSAIAAQDNSARIANIKAYLDARQARIDKYMTEKEFLEQVENYYVLQEGSARYMEYQSMRALNDFTKMTGDVQLKDDPKFNAFKEFEQLDLKAEGFDYLTYAGPSTYHYALGFNTMRLLDELGVDYKTYLLNKPEKPLHEYLSAHSNGSTDANN